MTCGLVRRPDARSSPLLSPVRRRVREALGCVVGVAPSLPKSRAEAERVLASRKGFRYFALMTVFVVAIARAVISVVDSADIPNVATGMWAIVTLTTVGYGDAYPHDTAGRVVGALLMLVGIGFISLLTAIIASTFVDSDEERATSALMNWSSLFGGSSSDSINSQQDSRPTQSCEVVMALKATLAAALDKGGIPYRQQASSVIGIGRAGFLRCGISGPAHRGGVIGGGKRRSSRTI